MSDNALELIKRRKKERALLRQKTLMDAEMNGGSRNGGMSEIDFSRDIDDTAVTGQGLFGRKYQAESQNQDRSPSPVRVKTQYELEIESRMEKINALSEMKVAKNDLMVVNYMLSDYDEVAEELKRAREEKRIQEQKKREAQEMARLQKVG
jgi:hypothetical protein